MSPRSLRTLALALACPLMLPAAGAQAASPKKKTVALPTITSVAPLEVGLGGSMTIKGKNFLAGTGKNTVVFKRDGGRAIFVKSGKSTKTTITLKIPSKLETYLAKKDGQFTSTKFRLRILAKRFGRNFTAVKMSPTIKVAEGTKAKDKAKDPAKDGSAAAPIFVAQPAPVVPPIDPDCDDDGIANVNEVDDDNDLLTDSEEKTLGLDPCSADTDGDGIIDGYEFYSAVSLNAFGAPPVPFPGPRRYPNPLDPEDANSDYDGDGLLMSQEYKLWVLKKDRRTAPNLFNYDSGKKFTPNSVNDCPSNTSTRDDLKDGDCDHLTNFEETQGPMQGPSWWKQVISEEPYEQIYVGTDFVDSDSDDDGILDGDDDNDFDDLTNREELDRRFPDATDNRPQLWANPFNPCLPNFKSRTCTVHPPANATFEPFKTYGIVLLSDNPPVPNPLPWPKPPVPGV